MRKIILILSLFIIIIFLYFNNMKICIKNNTNNNIYNVELLFSSKSVKINNLNKNSKVCKKINIESETALSVSYNFNKKDIFQKIDTYYEKNYIGIIDISINNKNIVVYEKIYTSILQFILHNKTLFSKYKIKLSK